MMCARELEYYQGRKFEGIIEEFDSRLKQTKNYNDSHKLRSTHVSRSNRQGDSYRGWLTRFVTFAPASHNQEYADYR